jgi:hypothetical protein
MSSVNNVNTSPTHLATQQTTTADFSKSTRSTSSATSSTLSSYTKAEQDKGRCSNLITSLCMLLYSGGALLLDCLSKIVTGLLGLCCSGGSSSKQINVEERLSTIAKQGSGMTWSADKEESWKQTQIMGVTGIAAKDGVLTNNNIRRILASIEGFQNELNKTMVKENIVRLLTEANRQADIELLSLDKKVETPVVTDDESSSS